MNDWEIIRHSVAIAGCVTDAQTGRPIKKAGVTITTAPLEFWNWLSIRMKAYGSQWAAILERPDRTLTASDGYFHFMDLPEGDYTLNVLLPGAGKRYGEAQGLTTVSRDSLGNIIMSSIDIALPPTTLKGRITKIDDQDSIGQSPVLMAEVRIKGNSEHAFSDNDGYYLLTGLEATDKLAYTVRVSAQGCEIAEQTVLLGSAGMEQTLDFELVPIT